MPVTQKKTPKLAVAILRRLANTRANSAIIGDLEEEFHALAEAHGDKYAHRWYWKTFITSLPSFLKDRIYGSAAMFKNYFKIALRNISRNKLSTIINSLGLAVGMACFILISLWVQDELNFDRFHEKKEDLYLLTITHPDGGLDPNVPYALAPILASQYPEIADYTRIFDLGYRTCLFSYQPETDPARMFYEKQVYLVDRGFFNMFSFPFVYGDAGTALAGRNAVVISAETAVKYFGEQNPVGKTLIFNNEQDLTVSAVVRVPLHSTIRFDFLVPLDNEMSDNWNWADPSYILLNDIADTVGFQEKIAGALNEHYPDSLPGTFAVNILPISQVHLNFGRRIYVYIFSVIAVFILLIACINYMNLATAGASNRTREVGLRKVVGARRSQLIFQFLGESTLMAALAVFLGFFLVKAALPYLNALTSKQLTLFSYQNPMLYAMLIALAVIVGILSGSYPALFLTAGKPVETLRTTFHPKSGRSLFRLVSVVGQFSISVLLIICTAVVFKQLRFVQQRPLGFSTEYVLKIPHNPDLRRRFTSFRNELLRNPNISYVSTSLAVPYDGDYKTSGIEWDNKDPEFIPNMRYCIADFDYFELFEMEIAAGRSFSREYRGDRRNFMINQTAARYMGMDDPIGMRLRFWGSEGQIIGVVKDFHQVSLHREIMPQLFTINPRLHNNWLKFVFIKVSAANLPNTLEHIKSSAVKFAPRFPFEYSFLDEGIGALYQSERKLGRIFTWFALLAVFISCLGIFGLSAFTAEQRTKEIGIRKVLGASTSGIAALLSKPFSLWILLANIIAWPISYYGMHVWLQNFAYRTGVSFFLFLSAGILSLIVAAIPVGFHALKAAAADPVVSLRYE